MLYAFQLALSLSAATLPADIFFVHSFLFLHFAISPFSTPSIPDGFCFSQLCFFAFSITPPPDTPRLNSDIAIQHTIADTDG